MNRGKMSFEDIAEKAWELEADRVILVNRWKGNPGKICLYLVGDEGLEPFPPLIYIYGVKLRRDMGIRLGKVRTLAVTATPERLRLARALAEFLEAPFVEPGGQPEVPVDLIMRVWPDRERYAVISFFRYSDGREVGPRIRVRHLIWELE